MVRCTEFKSHSTTAKQWLCFPLRSPSDELNARLRKANAQLVLWTAQVVDKRAADRALRLAVHNAAEAEQKQAYAERAQRAEVAAAHNDRVVAAQKSELTALRAALLVLQDEVT